MRMKRPYINHFTWVMLCTLCAALMGCGNDGNLPIGTREQADSVLQPHNNEYESGKQEEALLYVDSAFSSRADHTVYEYISYYGTHAYVTGGNLHKTVRYADSAIDLLKQYKYLPQLADEIAGFLMSRGEANFNLRNYDVAYADFAEAIRMARAGGSACRKMLVPYTIAMILYRQQHYANSASYFKECYLFIDECEGIIGYRNNRKQEVLDNIGLCYTKLKKYDSAMLYYRQALDIVSGNKFTMAVDSGNSMSRQAAASGVITGNMAKVFLGKGQTDSAIYYYKRAIAFNAGIGHDKHDMQICMVQLSDIYLSQNAIGPLGTTLRDLKGALDTMPAPDIQMDYERLMYAYHERNNNPAQALKFLESYLHKKDSVAAAQKVLLETDISKELKDKQQQFEIELLQKNNQISKTYLWVLIVFSSLVIIILGLIYYMYRTSRKNVTRLTTLNKEIEAANAEKDRILRVVAHDLRNPIGGIATLSELMMSGHMVNEQGQPYLKAIASASASSISLIQELLNTGKPDAVKEQRVTTDMRSLLQQIVNLVAFKASEKQQAIELDLPDDPVMLKTYPRQVERIMDNLIVNAIKFSGPGAVTRVNLEVHALDVLITVQDEGIGIGPEDMIKIFNRFTTIRRPGTAGEKSFGLGLSICRQIVESIGGRIWAESEVGEGSTFYVSLPQI
jgi:two-component system sensor histidine kinase VicK